MMRVFPIKYYLKFLVTSSNQHGVHSPFVYQLVTKCFYDKKEHPSYKLLRDFRKEITTIKEKISSDSSTQKLQEIPRFFELHGLSGKRQRLLNRLSWYFKLKTALVIDGTLGGEAVSLSAGNPVSVYATEKFPEQTKKILKKPKFSILSPIFLKEDLRMLPQKKFDLIYINAVYNPENAHSVFSKMLSFLHNDSVVIVTGIHLQTTKKAWQQIKKHPKVRVSIDTFSWGFVFFRKEQVREHFKIRI